MEVQRRDGREVAYGRKTGDGGTEKGQGRDGGDVAERLRTVGREGEERWRSRGGTGEGQSTVGAEEGQWRDSKGQHGGSVYGPQRS